jgi:hypothetical protein
MLSATVERSVLPWEEGRETLLDRGFAADSVALKDIRLFSVKHKDDSKQYTVRVGDSELKSICKSSVSELGKILHANLSLLSSITDDALSERVFKHYVDRSGVGEVVLSYDRDGVRGVYPESAKYLDPLSCYDLLRESLGAASPGISYVLCDGKRNGAVEFMGLTDVAMNPPRKVGDRSHAGINLRLNGGGFVEPAVYTLRCTNGLICSQPSHVEEVTQTTIHEAVGRAQTYLSRFIALDEQPVSAPPAMVSRIARELNLSDRVTRGIQDAVSTRLQGDNVSAYELLNVVTNLGVGTGETRYARLGDLFIEPLEAARCDQCGAEVL